MPSSYEFLGKLAPQITNELVVTSIGDVIREGYNLKHRPGNMYHIAMSGASGYSLGLALALPHRRVISLDGDGSILMTLNLLPVIARMNPPNLIVIVIDNEMYAAAGNVPALTGSTANLAEIARASGIKNVFPVREVAEFEDALGRAFKGTNASFIPLKCLTPSPEMSGMSLDGPENKYQFLRYIEETEHIQLVQAHGKGKRPGK